jgi:3D (Asp-Asp-Asp) domain-containing protein
MKNTIKKIAVWRLILAVVLLTSLPAQASAAWTDTLGNWLKDNIGSMAWAQKTETDAVDTLATIKGTALMSVHQPLISIIKVYEIFVTGYSSSVDETDSTPFITASGETVRDGIVATNFLPFNTKIKIPEIFGNKIFVVKDRMNRRFTDKMDIWFASKDLAKQFGKKKLQVQVIEETI